MSAQDLSGFAIVGMSGRFPGADDPAQLWELLLSGRNAVSKFDPSELQDSFDAETRGDPNFVPARSILKSVDQFDADFFGMSRREAELTDPQQRLFLECAWQALEDAGCDSERFAGVIGVFAGSAYNSYFIRHVMADRAAVDRFTSDFQVGSYPQLLGALHDFVATRVCYKLNLKGPGVAVQSACSTSLLAVAQACQSLAFHQTDVALAGGVSITLPQERGYLYQDGGMVSPDGTCRPFDANAAGTVFGSGAGVVVLKRLADAIAAGDRIYAVVRGFGVNNDGAGKVGFTAPSVEGQAECVASALGMAGVDPGEIGYVECHGTATPLGDPIEIEGLSRAFADPEVAPNCVLGSIKANLGHLDAAAGVAGLIKTALILSKGEIPPQIHFDQPNPRIDLKRNGFRINTSRESWPAGPGPRRAGVSAFGVGGTNVHLVLEEPPAAAEAALDSDGPVVLPVSARDAAALKDAKARLAAALDAMAASGSRAALADVARTLRQGRREFSARSAVAARDFASAAAELRSAAAPTATVADAAPFVAFMFPGQGSQYPSMCRALYDRDAGFRRVIDEGAKTLAPLLGCDIRDHLLDERPGDEDQPHPIRSTVLAQPALFLVEYALAKLFERLGVRPDAMIGHSLGELTAACLAGVMTFEDALTLIAWRGKLMQKQPGGAMLSVRMAAAELRPLLPATVAIAADNAPKLCVAAGPYDAIDALAKELEARGVGCRRLHTSHAFHSPMIEPVVGALLERIKAIPLKRPTRPFVSCVTGQWITAEQATSHEYWAQHCRATVAFASGVDAILEDPAAKGRPIVLIEIGPGRTLSTFADASRSATPRVSVQTVPDFAERERTDLAFAEALGALWTNAVPVDLRGLGPIGSTVVGLPTYPFQRKRHWIDAPRPAASGATAVAVAAPPVEFQAPPQAAARPAQLHAPSQAALHSSVQSNDGAMTQNVTQGFDVSKSVSEALAGLVEEQLGAPVPAEAYGATFRSLGCDSLVLGQIAQRLNKRFGVKVTFRQLMRELPSIEAAAAHVVSNAPAEKLPAAPQASAAAPQAAPLAAAAPQAVIAPPAAQVAASAFAPMFAAPASADAAGPIANVIRDQLVAMQSIFSAQIAALGGAPALAASAQAPTGSAQAPAVAAPAAQPVAPTPVAAAPAASAPAVAGADEPPSRFRAYKPGGDGSDLELDANQKRFVENLIAQYNAKTPGSKSRTQATRRALADPRSVSGFQPTWKELVYPIVCDRSKGARIHDVDGNSYIDLVNGYGQTMFGHAPDFVTAAVEKQLKDGFAIGPQSPLAGEVASMVATMTGNERVAFCNTGSEAVMAAMRMARAVTGRTRVVMFGGAYHGQFDEVLVKGKARSAPKGALPIAPGIPVESVGSMVVLPNASPESLEWVRANADDLAAVVVEPVQSRHPDIRPREFLQELRAITEKSGSALVFDEVVTGFRVHPGGMQALYGIRADLATYGKVLGGGMPIGVVAGRSEFMDALDGGYWEFGDDSQPETAPTFFAGTFVRHPLVLAAAHAVLKHIEAKGAGMYDAIGDRASRLFTAIKADIARRGLDISIEGFSSWFYMDVAGNGPLASLLFPQLRLLGVNVHEGFPCFLTTEHGEEEIAFIQDAFSKALDAMQAGGALIARDGAAPAGAESAPARQDDGSPSVAPMTEPQKEILLAAQMGDAASMAFNESISLRFDGPFDPAAMVKAIDDAAARHEALRMRVNLEEQTLAIEPAPRLDTPVLDLTGADAEARLAELIAEDARTPFDLVGGPLARALIARLAPDQHVLVFTAHHIICDGWSMSVLVNDLAALYRARVSGRPHALSPPASFRRYALDQQKNDSAQHSAYWRGVFAKTPVAVELPADRPRPELKTFNGASLRDALGGDLFAKLSRFASERDVTLFPVLFAGVQALFQRLASEGDVVLTVPMAGQSLVDEQDFVGHCVNFLPIAVDLDLDRSFLEHLAKVDARLSEALDHQDYTLGTLVRDLGLPRTPNRTPLSDIQFNLEKFGASADFGEAKVKISTNAKAFVNFDLFLNLVQRSDDVIVEVDYSTDLYDGATIVRWLGHLRQLLASAVDAPDARIRDLSLLTADERLRLVDASNVANVAIEDKLVHELFEAQSDASPNAVAVVFDGVATTYKELESRANRLAEHVRRAAPQPGQRIAVCLDRSTEMLVALLAVQKAGHAYVPLDPTHPESRLSLILSAADVAAVIATRASTPGDALRGKRVIDPEAEMAAIAACSDARKPRAEGIARDPAAYVIFTSGSTGVPKGVELGHRSVVNFLRSMSKRPGFTATDSILAVTTLSFDIAVLELFLPITVGGRTIIADRATLTDPVALTALAASSGATVMQATPSLFRALLEADFKPKKGARILCGGEPLPRDVAQALISGGAELWNMYGPTETTVWSSCSRVLDTDKPIVIGEPIDNTGLLVLDGDDKVCPIGVVGELCISGAGLAHGYFRRDDLTKAAFVEIGLNGAPLKVYRTGDLARRLGDSSLQLLGRKDLQVKIRGFRIELEEIEATLRSIPSIRDAAVSVMDKGTSDATLVAHYVADADLPAEAIRAFCSSRLPHYMVPARFARRADLPRTANLKLDRKALAARLAADFAPQAPSAAAPARSRPAAPSDATTNQILAVWEDVLGRKGLSADDKLFALGAHSLHIFRMASRLAQLKLPIEARHLMQNPSASDLAAMVAEGSAEKRPQKAAPSLSDFKRGARRGGRRG